MSDHYQLVRLGEIVKLTNGFPFRSEFFGTEGSLAIIRNRDVVRGFSTTYYSGPYSEEYLVERGDLLLSMDGDFRVGVWAATPALLNQRVCRIRATPAVDQQFLRFYLPAQLQRIQDATPFATVKHLSAKTIGSIQVRLPGLKEQQRVGTMLTKADAIRRKRREGLRLLDEFLRSKFLEMFGDPVRNEKAWELVRLGDCLLEKAVIGTITPASDAGELRVVRVGELGTHDVAIERAGSVSVPANEIPRFETREGDLLLARAIGSEQHLGKASVMQKHPDRVLFDSHVMRLRFDPAQVLSSFVWQLLRSGGGRRLLLMQGGRTSVQFNINASQLAELRLPLPPVELQKRFLMLAQRARAIQSKQNAACVTTDLLFHSLALSAFGPNH